MTDKVEALEPLRRVVVAAAAEEGAVGDHARLRRRAQSTYASAELHHRLAVAVRLACPTRRASGGAARVERDSRPVAPPRPGIRPPRRSRRRQSAGAAASARRAPSRRSRAPPASAPAAAAASGGVRRRAESSPFSARAAPTALVGALLLRLRLAVVVVGAVVGGVVGGGEAVLLLEGAEGLERRLQALAVVPTRRPSSGDGRLARAPLLDENERPAQRPRALDRVVRRRWASWKTRLHGPSQQTSSPGSSHTAHTSSWVSSRVNPDAGCRPLGLLLVGARRLVELAQPAGVLVDPLVPLRRPPAVVHLHAQAQHLHRHHLPSMSAEDRRLGLPVVRLLRRPPPRAAAAALRVAFATRRCWRPSVERHSHRVPATSPVRRCWIARAAGRRAPRPPRRPRISRCAALRLHESFVGGMLASRSSQASELPRVDGHAQKLAPCSYARWLRTSWSSC